MKIHFPKIIFITLLMAFFILPTAIVFAQTTTEERQALEQELLDLENKITQYEQDITKTQQEKNTLQNQVNTLKSKIKKLDLQIKENNLMVKDLGYQITDTETSIKGTTQKIEDTKIKLGKVLQAVSEEDQKNIAEILIGEEKISNFFDNLVALNNLNIKTQVLLSDIKDLKINLENQVESLDQEKDDLEKLLKIQLLQKQDLSLTTVSQQKLLEETKGKEANYQKLLEESKKKATEIRSRIFELIGVAKAPTFGEAYAIAKFVSGITGVRPAFLLAIITQESNLGKNVGKCYLVNAKTGEGVVVETNKRAAKTMNPKRDVTPFLKITQDLGRDPYKTPVSCPMSFGWGGAMGPAQFIPSTWISFADGIKKITGAPGDPWNIKDSFIAAGLFLKKYGAASQKSTDEWKSAMIYFSGSSTNTRYRFYADSVLNIAKQYEEDIKAIDSSLTLNKN